MGVTGAGAAKGEAAAEVETHQGGLDLPFGPYSFSYACRAVSVNRGPVWEEGWCDWPGVRIGKTFPLRTSHTLPTPVYRALPCFVADFF
jgi:hypothetical protein